jgi:hypothetical protein
MLEDTRATQTMLRRHNSDSICRAAHNDGAPLARRRISYGHIESTAAALRREPCTRVAGDEAAAYRREMRISLSSSVILTPGWSRKNRISEEGSLEEYTPLT